MDRRQRAWAALCSFVLLVVQSSNLSAAAYEFTVGDSRGWSVPSGRDQTDMYNQWAARNRFQIGDTLLFKYNRSSDSVVQVSTAEEYRSCNTSKSLRTFNDGNTVFKLERSGAFYFITGASGNCRKGLKMILVVMAPRHRPGGRAAPAPSPSMALAPRSQLASSPAPFAGNFPAPAPSIASAPSPSMALAPRPQLASSPSPFAGNFPAPAPSIASAPSPSMALAPRPQLASSPAPFAGKFTAPAPSIASSPTPSINGGVPGASSPPESPSGSPPAPSTAAPSTSTEKTSPPPALAPSMKSASLPSAPNLFWNLLCASIGLLGLLVFI